MPSAIPTSDDIAQALRAVIDPELGADVVELGMVQSIAITPDGAVTIGLALTIAACPMRDQIQGDVVRKISAMPGVRTCCRS